jgi:hypothetical protein
MLEVGDYVQFNAPLFEEDSTCAGCPSASCLGCIGIIKFIETAAPINYITVVWITGTRSTFWPNGNSSHSYTRNQLKLVEPDEVTLIMLSNI